MPTPTHPHRPPDTESDFTPPPSSRKRLMLVGMIAFGALLAGIVVFAFVSMLRPDRYDRLTVQDLMDRPAQITPAPALDTPSPTAPEPRGIALAPSTPESTPRP